MMGDLSDSRSLLDIISPHLDRRQPPLRAAQRHRSLSPSFLLISRIERIYRRRGGRGAVDTLQYTADSRPRQTLSTRSYTVASLSTG